MLYRILRAIRGGYGFAAMALFGLLFLTALALVFLLPVGSVVVLLGSILLLVLVWLGSEVLGYAERALARPLLRRETCPCCGGELVRTATSPVVDPALSPPIDPTPAAVLQCTRCPEMFLESGEVFREDPDFRVAARRGAR